MPYRRAINTLKVTVNRNGDSLVYECMDVCVVPEGDKATGNFVIMRMAPTDTMRHKTWQYYRNRPDSVLIDPIVQLYTEELQAEPALPETCKWSEHPIEMSLDWKSGCGHVFHFMFNDVEPGDEQFVYCPYCGLVIEIVKKDGGK